MNWLMVNDERLARVYFSKLAFDQFQTRLGDEKRKKVWRMSNIK